MNGNSISRNGRRRMWSSLVSIFYQDDALVKTDSWCDTDDFIAQQLGEAPGSHYSAFLFRRRFVEGIPHRTLFPSSNFASRDDRCFILEVTLRNPQIAVCSMPTLMLPPAHEGSASVPRWSSRSGNQHSALVYLSSDFMFARSTRRLDSPSSTGR
jgi:hypothetical protein